MHCLQSGQPLLVVEDRLLTQIGAIDEQVDLRRHHDLPGSDQSGCCDLQRETDEPSMSVGILETCSAVAKAIIGPCGADTWWIALGVR